MPKKKIFNKDNSVKFLLLHGNTEAVNADGETLENVLVPVSKNYKSGTSLLLSNMAALGGAEDPSEDNAEEPDLERILDTFDDDADSDILCDDMASKMKKLNLSKKTKSKSLHKEDGDFTNDKLEVLGQFSDASEDLFNSDIDSESDDDVAIDPNCPEILKVFNAKFDKVLEEYDDDQIGALDEEEISGYLSASSKQVTDLYQAEQNIGELIVLGKCDKEIKDKILSYAEESGDETVVEIVTEKPIEFDCESILSTYSNKYNHPTVIREEKVRKIKIPDNPLKKKLTKSQLKTLSNDKESDTESDDNITVSTAFNVRIKGETPEQRRERKNMFKEAKRESRIMKKENKLAFKKEKKLQKSQAINAQQNVGIRLL